MKCQCIGAGAWIAFIAETEDNISVPDTNLWHLKKNMWDRQQYLHSYRNQSKLSQRSSAAWYSRRKSPPTNAQHISRLQYLDRSTCISCRSKQHMIRQNYIEFPHVSMTNAGHDPFIQCSIVCWTDNNTSEMLNRSKWYSSICSFCWSTIAIHKVYFELIESSVKHCHRNGKSKV